MRQYICFYFLICTLIAFGQERKNWDMEKMKTVIDYAKEIRTFALVVQEDGEILVSYGNIDKVSRVHSVRKAIISALVFQNLDKIKLDATLKDLNIQDSPIQLTELQRQAKVIHLLKSISGINHPTGAQIGAMQANRDSLLGSEPNIPGTKWAYNNWDYNVLTTILEQETGKNISELFKEGIANPLGINDFEVIYKKDRTLSQHDKAGFRLSTRDMAKFGQLYLNLGKWGGKQLIPKEWIKKITTDFTITNIPNYERYGHGYLWWILDKHYAEGLLPRGCFVATGAWGQRILIIPQWKMVVANKTMTETPYDQRIPVTDKEFEKLIILLANARI